MDLNNVLFALAMVAFFSTGRAIYVLMGVLYGVKTLSEYTEYEQALKQPKAKKIIKEVKELSVLLVVISGIGFAMFLFATSGSM